MNYAKPIRDLQLLVASLACLTAVLSGCDDDKQGIELSIPAGQDVAWQYEVWQTGLDDSTRIGSLHVANVGQIDFEDRSDILRQRNIKYLNTAPEDSSISSSYLDLSGTYKFEHFAGSYYEMYRATLDRDVLDTLTREQPEGPDFQNFYEYSPGWVVLARFDESTTSSYEVHKPRKVYLDFSLRGHQITGLVNVSTKGLFLGSERISVPLRDSIFTYKIRHATHFDFNVSRDSVELPTFRETFHLTTWYHPEAGIVQQYRSPIALDIPSVPSRYPSIYVPGEVWALKDVVGFSL